MNNIVSTDRLYALLPAIYRIRDGAVGEPLRTLLGILEQEVNILESDIDQLYDDWFIETCTEWVVPYIGDLLDVHELYAERASDYGQQERRAYVANTLAYRRRKGTTPILEQLARDVTGWRARVVEFGRLLQTSQHLDHLRLNSQTVNLRQNSQLEEIGTPFEQQAAYSAEVRSVNQGGRYGLSHMGLFIWRLQSYPLERVQARLIPDGGDGRYYSFNPLGQTARPLFNQPQTETDIVTLAQEINVSAILRRPVLATELLERRQNLIKGEPLKGIRYFDSDPVLQIFINGQPNPILPEEILITRLDTVDETSTQMTQSAPSPDWPASVENILENRSDDVTILPYVVAVDPKLGRLAFLGETLPQRVETSYFYGFSDDVGGGPYGRTAVSSLAFPQVDPSQPLPIDPLRWDIQQTKTGDANPLATAVQTWNQTVLAWEGLKHGDYLPLAEITIAPVQVVDVTLRSLTSPSFHWGIVEDGFRVEQGICPDELFVFPGRAFDRQGRCVESTQLMVLKVSALELNQQPEGTGILVLIYQPEGDNFFQVISAAELEVLSPGTVIPLAKLRVNGQNRLAADPDETVKVEFRPGIVQGLTVEKRAGTFEAWVSAGTGITPQGQVITLTTNLALDLLEVQGSQQALVWIEQQGDWQLVFMAPGTLLETEEAYLYLATLDIPRPQLAIDTTASQRFRDALPTVTGLVITPLVNTATLQISAGTIGQGNAPIFELQQQALLELSSYAGRTLILFVSPRPDQGLPLANLGGDSRRLGIVPKAPTPDNSQRIGQIVVWDNGTYCGNLPIAITPLHRLEILAADGYRPHILGDISISALAPKVDLEPSRSDLAVPDVETSLDSNVDHSGMLPEVSGELVLNGLLIEGDVRLLPGSLRQLLISHCTVVPQAGCLQVLSPDLVEEDCLPEEDHGSLSLISVVIYALVLLWQLICQELGMMAPGAEPLTLKAIIEETLERFAVWWDAWQSGKSKPDDDQVWDYHHDHDRLEISLDHSITGKIDLLETVPYLSIDNCIVDHGNYGETSEVAIAAPGSQTHIQTSTILGRTIVRNLEASNCLFTEKVTVQQRQTGCVRFSYVPIASRTPQRYQCQPDQALRQALTTIPNGISSLFSSSSLLLLGTAGQGLFQWQLFQDNAVTDTSSSDPTASDTTNTDGNSQTSNVYTEWIALNGDLTDLHLTAITAYEDLDSNASSNNENAPGNVSENNVYTRIVVVGTAAGQVFYTTLRVAETRELGTSLPPQAWQVIQFGTTNTAITQLFQDLQPGLDYITETGEQLSEADTPYVWIATAGDGLYRGPLAAVTQNSPDLWQPINQGLGNLDITDLLRDSQGQLWAATAGGGVYCLEREYYQNVLQERWVAKNQGLCSLHITALIDNRQGYLIAATQDGVFIRSLEESTWKSSELQNGDISVLAISGDATSLIIAGTNDGKTFRSNDGGLTWITLSLDQQGTGITTLIARENQGADDPQKELWIGTESGDILQSRDGGNSWQSRYQSLPNVADKLQILQRLQPTFTATDYGAPGYCQLTQTTALELHTGGSDGAEMGVFHSLKQPQREANLRASLDEYLRFGLTAGIFYMT